LEALSTVQTIIEKLGFPIACVIFLGWFVWKIWNQQQSQNEKREEKLYSFISQAQVVNEKLTQTNSEFVAVLTEYKSDLESIKTDVNVIKNNMKG
jgi:predicted negative regulator of RcsB-dependent stress response